MLTVQIWKLSNFNSNLTLAGRFFTMRRPPPKPPPPETSPMDMVVVKSHVLLLHNSFHNTITSVGKIYLFVAQPLSRKCISEMAPP